MRNIIIRYAAKGAPWLKLQVTSDEAATFELIGDELVQVDSRPGTIFIVGNPAGFAHLAGITATALASCGSDQEEITLVPGVDLTVDSPRLRIVVE